MAVKMKNALVGSVGLFAIAMAFALLAIPQVSYADQAVDESDALAAADETGHGWVRDESDNWLYYDAQSNRGRVVLAQSRDRRYGCGRC